MGNNASVPTIQIYTNGPLRSRRYIIDENNAALTAQNVSSIRLSVYRQTLDGLGNFQRTPVTNWTGVTIAPATAIIPECTSASGKKYNFRYCIEGAFTEPNATYIIEYVITLTNDHSIVIAIKANTTI